MKTMFVTDSKKQQFINPVLHGIIKNFTAQFYQIAITGVDHIPKDSPALIIANHVTEMDPLLISCATNRKICFVINRRIANNPKLKQLYKRMHIMTISDDDDVRHIAGTFKKAEKALANGYLVCVFPEEDITANGNMRCFQSYPLHILKNSNIPVIPLYIGGAWQGPFSYTDPAPASLKKRKKQNVNLIFGCKRPANTNIHHLRLIIQQLSGTYFTLLKNKQRNLINYFVKTARKNWNNYAIGDSTGKRLTFGETLTAAIAIKNKFIKKTVDKDKVGILLPASVGAALANLAITISGKIPVNLNFSVSEESINSAIQQCEITHIITSKKFIKHLPGKNLSVELVYLEDISAAITGVEKLNALREARFSSPKQIAGNNNHPSPDDIATIIFSSGSTGEQKGILLTHHNIISNIEAFLEVFQFDSDDIMCGILPFFHSFGYTATLWCPLLRGFPAYYHTNPLEAEKIAGIVRNEKLTVMLATPTFLLSYIRKAKENDFKTLRYVITGAEKLRKHIADSFDEKFKIRPIEGYGATELSPVVSVNIPDTKNEENEIVQIGTKEGSIGHPIPGIAARITDLDSGEMLPPDKEGMLEIRGPNLMAGYLNNKKLTEENIHNDWYLTGDIARIDEDGFIFIHDRLARFSKIAGEMVPHVLIEDLLISKLKIPDRSIFVTAVPDNKRGEQLVVIYTPDAGPESAIRHTIQQSDIPNLWKPKKQNYLFIEEMPVTGSGKIDMRKIIEATRDYMENKPSILSRTINKIRTSI